MNTSFVCLLSVFDQYRAPVVKTLVRPVFDFDLTEMLVMVAMFVAVLRCAYHRGYRHGYARGLQDGNPFPRLRVGSPYWNWLARVFAE